jgi:AcrR family transcriptional regulator
MTRSNASPDHLPGSEAPPADGRRLRGQDSRARIVGAMLEIIREGEVAPGAEQVAARAEVGLRTVFRHFQDMDSLYREMSGAIEAVLRDIIDQPFRSESWRDQVMELIERRAQAFETIGPYKRAGDAIRHRSPFLQADSSRLSRALREILVGVLPAEVAARPDIIEPLDLLLSFETWSRLRREQRLEPEAAQAVVTGLAARLIGED